MPSPFKFVFIFSFYKVTKILIQFIIGSGENISEFTYVENVSHAHICAEESLHFRMASIAGKVL